MTPEPALASGIVFGPYFAVQEDPLNMLSRCLPLPACAGKHASSFFNDNEMIRSDRFELLLQPARPANLNVRSCFRSQSEVQPRIVRRIETRLAHNFLRLFLRAVVKDNPRSDGAAVRFSSNQ